MSVRGAVLAGFAIPISRSAVMGVDAVAKRSVRRCMNLLLVFVVLRRRMSSVELIAYYTQNRFLWCRWREFTHIRRLLYPFFKVFRKGVVENIKLSPLKL